MNEYKYQGWLVWVVIVKFWFSVLSDLKSYIITYQE